MFVLCLRTYIRCFPHVADVLEFWFVMFFNISSDQEKPNRIQNFHFLGMLDVHELRLVIIFQFWRLLISTVASILLETVWEYERGTLVAFIVYSRSMADYINDLTRCNSFSVPWRTNFSRFGQATCCWDYLPALSSLGLFAEI